MVDIALLLTRIERKRLWAYFHKDWLLQIRELLRPQLPQDLAIFVESEANLEVEEEIERFEQYSLLIRRAPENRIVAAAEILSPTNNGVFGLLDKEKYLRKREAYFEAAINLLEIDALTEGVVDRAASASRMGNCPRPQCASRPRPLQPPRVRVQSVGIVGDVIGVG